jgi:hypothetical protein
MGDVVVESSEELTKRATSLEALDILLSTSAEAHFRIDRPHESPFTC